MAKTKASPFQAGDLVRLRGLERLGCFYISKVETDHGLSHLVGDEPLIDLEGMEGVSHTAPELCLEAEYQASLATGDPWAELAGEWKDFLAEVLRKGGGDE